MAFTADDLRWPVTLYHRQTEPDPAGQGTIDIDTQIATMRASIEAIRPGIFYGTTEAANVMPTHSIIIRGNLYLDQNSFFVRTRTYSDGSTHSEHFRVHRVLEVDGDNRFTKLECHLDRVS